MNLSQAEKEDSTVLKRDHITKEKISFIVINGMYMHTILKKVKKVIFKVQNKFDENIHEYSLSQTEINLDN